MSENKKHINLDYLEMMADNDAEMRQTMIEMLLEELPDEIQKMTACTANNRWEELSSVSHKMKSTLAFVGYDAMVEVNKEIELLAKHEEDLPRIKELMQQLEHYLTLVLPELQQELNG